MLIGTFCHSFLVSVVSIVSPVNTEQSSHCFENASESKRFPLLNKLTPNFCEKSDTQSMHTREPGLICHGGLS